MPSLFRTATATAAILSLTSIAIATPTSTETYSPPLPTIDLGYQLQRATVLNETGQYYNFSNIRYARAPTGDLRFRAPQPPLHDRSKVHTGEIGRICPQAGPAWYLTAAQFIPQYLAGKTQFSPSDFNTSSGASSVPAQDPRTTEDCLFLDVMVPRHIFENRKKKKAPVLVWVYGGGYTGGSKGDSGNPAGLLARSQNNRNNGVVYVALNYRLGAFGWLSGSTFQEDGTANAGLYDQRLALEWVKQQIGKFGGDPERVTVFGESAGGGSIMHQITAFGGLNGPAPFQQAVLQSPGFQPIVSSVLQEQVFNNYLALLNVSSIAEARTKSYEALQTANVIQVGLQSQYGSFTYGPVVDGLFAPQLPGQLLARGQFDKTVKVMVGHNANEGLLFTSPYISNNSAFDQFVQDFLPTAKAFPEVATYISEQLYPPVFDGSQAQGYTDNIGRASAVSAESIFVCNTFYLDKAFHNRTYAYLFAVPPALHGADIPYTFYNGPNPSSVTAPKIALALQEYITHFAEFGNPSERGVPHFSMYSDDARIQVLNATGIREARDPAANERCEWWQRGLYY